jgi:hypothetical protein
MTESEWLSCTDINRMLKFLRSRCRHGWLPWQNCTFPEASERKLLLFACACFRRDVLRDPVRATNRKLEAVSVVETWVDVQESVSELDTARPYCWFSPPVNVLVGS